MTKGQGHSENTADIYFKVEKAIADVYFDSERMVAEFYLSVDTDVSASTKTIAEFYISVDKDDCGVLFRC